MVTLTGLLEQANRSVGEWALLTEDGIQSGKTYPGGPGLDGLQVGKRYRFKCAQVTGLDSLLAGQGDPLLASRRARVTCLPPAQNDVGAGVDLRIAGEHLPDHPHNHRVRRQSRGIRTRYLPGTGGRRAARDTPRFWASTSAGSAASWNRATRPHRAAHRQP